MATTAFITIALDDTAETDIKQSTELIHRLIPGSHVVDSRNSSGADATFFEWDESDPLPLGPDQVRAILEANPRPGSRHHSPDGLLQGRHLRLRRHPCPSSCSPSLSNPPRTRPP